MSMVEVITIPEGFKGEWRSHVTKILEHIGGCQIYGEDRATHGKFQNCKYYILFMEYSSIV